MTELMSGRRAWWLCTLLFMAGALSYLDRQVLSILAPRIIAEFGMSNTDYSRVLFAYAANHRVVDVFQPDVEWAGGLTACVRIAHLAEAAGIGFAPHCGVNTPFGQHLVYALPNSPLAECFVGTPAGVPLEQTTVIPGMPMPKDGFLVPSDAPGFGMEITDAWLDSMRT